MNKIMTLLFLIATVGAGAFIAGCSKDHGHGGATATQQSKTLYTCGMHPQVIQDHPGNCPICGMKLTPIGNSESQTIAIDPVTIQNMGIRTATVRRGPLRRVIRTVGVIDYNETTLGEVTTKFKGWIEKLYVNATGQLAMRGDPLFEIYSPELYSAQVEYLLAAGSPANSTPGVDEVRNSART